ncbi:MAG: hypothetical protein JWN99_3239 [Ilumatobacteraceae bacterium]|nr:hypothetical protein [Ilumatobacteraceae bacterium]
MMSSSPERSGSTTKTVVPTSVGGAVAGVQGSSTSMPSACDALNSRSWKPWKVMRGAPAKYTVARGSMSLI